MWTLQLKSMPPTPQPNNIKRHNLLILKRLRRAYFSLRQCSKQQQFLRIPRTAEDEILLFYLLEKREKGRPDPAKPHIHHFSHILKTKATSPCQTKGRQHLQHVSTSHRFSHGAAHLPPWHLLERASISQTPGITALWEILLDCTVCIFHFPQRLLLRFFIGVWSHSSSDW